LIAPLARLLAACTLLASIAGCGVAALREASAGAERVELEAVPFYPQRRYQCGPAALASVLVASGVNTDADALVREVYVSGLKGSLQAELLASARRHERVAYVIAAGLPDLLHELEGGRPVLILQNFGLTTLPLWHYAVVIGYDRPADQFLVRNGRDARRRIAARRLVATWRRAGYWGLVVLRPGEIAASATPARYLDAVAALGAVGRPESVAAAIEAAVARWPAESLTWLALGNLRLEQQRPRDAEQAFEHAVGLAPSGAAARNNLALLLSRRGCNAAAIAEIARAWALAASTTLAATGADSDREIRERAAGAAGADAGACPAAVVP
jgi:tetratricopeptide (TPR) repeat protein